MKTHPFFIFVSLILLVCSCSSTPDISKLSEPTNQLSFVDIGKFDTDLSNSLSQKFESVNIVFYEKVSPNQMPARLQKWVSSVEQSGGQVSVEPPPGELAPKDPFTVIGLLSSIIGGAKNFAEFKTNRAYDVAKGRDAVISLERNTKGEVVVAKIQFTKRHNADSDKK